MAEDGLTVGVIVPVFNRPAKLRRALRSILKQTRLPEQVIVVDDASTDAPDARSVAAMFSGLGVDVAVHRLPVNGGPAAARQAGLERLRTQFVAFLDSDDAWRSDKLQRQMKALATMGDDTNRTALATGFRYFDEIGFVSEAMTPKPAFRVGELVSGCWYNPGSTVVVSRDGLLHAGGFDTSLRRLEDLDLFARFAMAGGRLEVANFVGADIERGRNAASADVGAAIAHLTEKFSAEGTHPLSNRDFRRLRAWLAVEQAATARNRGNWLAVARWMATSQVHSPRVGVQLGDWWKPIGDTAGVLPPELPDKSS